MGLGSVGLGWVGLGGVWLMGLIRVRACVVSCGDAARVVWGKVGRCGVGGVGAVRCGRWIRGCEGGVWGTGGADF